MTTKDERVSDGVLKALIGYFEANPIPLHREAVNALRELQSRRASAPDVLGKDELEVWARVLPHPQAGTSDLRYLYSLALLRARPREPGTE